MILKKARVGLIAPGDSEVGSYTAFLENPDGSRGDTPIRVSHTSPYKTFSGGLVAFPSYDELILVCQTDDELDKKTWYYLCTVVGITPTNVNADPDIESKQTNVSQQATGRLGVPQKAVIAGPHDHKIELRHDYDKSNMESGIYLETKSGKVIKLEDGPDKNNIVVRTEKGIFGSVASIELTSTTDLGSSRPSYGIRFYSTGPMSMVTRDSNIDLQIIDGGRINIENKSSGIMRAGPLDPTCGNINIKSHNGDINIVAGLDPLSGELTPPTVGPAAPLASVNINALGGPLTSLNIHTDGVLNLSGGTAVRIAGGDLRFDVAGIAPVQIDGVVVNINPIA